MKQDDVASLLGITQTAVSKYISNVRGQAIRIDQSEQIRSMMSDIASKIADGQISGPVLMVRFCEVCRVVRQDGLMCDLCRRSDPTLDARKCYICKPEKPAGVR
jgi:predicted transcriptional regulator